MRRESTTPIRLKIFHSAAAAEKANHKPRCNGGCCIPVRKTFMIQSEDKQFSL
jgi:hypothetical protein